MTWKQALLKSIEKWDRICFEGVHTTCALCEKADGCCAPCILEIVGAGCFDGPYSGTSCDRDDYDDFGCDEDIHMYLFLCMLYHEYYEVSQ